MVWSGGKGMTSSDWKRTALSTSLSGTKGRSISRVMARSPAMPTMTDLLENWPFFHSFLMASVTEDPSRISPSTSEPGGRPTWP